MSDEDLRSVEYPVTVRVCGGREDIGCVTSGRRLGQRPGADLFAASETRQEAPALVVGAGSIDMSDAKAVVGRHRECNRRTDPRKFFDTETVGQGRHGGAAVFLGDLDAHETETPEGGYQFGGEVLVLIPAVSMRSNLGFGEFADGSFEKLLVGTQCEIHGSFYRSLSAAR